MKQKLSMCVGLGLLSVLASCASRMSPVEISSTANAGEELSIQQRMIETGYLNQVDVLATENFDKSREHFSKAKKLNKKGAPASEILVSIGYSRAYLEHANKDAASVHHLKEITQARQQAISAGARNFPEQLEALDSELEEMSSSDSGRFSIKEKVALQSRYLKLELHSIKSAKLGAVTKLLKKAQDKDAEDIIPKAYSEAVSKFHIASKLIDTDRHSTLPLHTAVTDAEISAERVLSLLESEKKSRKQTPEERAVALESRDNAVKMANTQIFKIKSDSLEKDLALVEQGKMIFTQKAEQIAAEDENEALRLNESDEKMVNDAAALFTKAEAEVYRQDGVLIIRLKSMNFASGRSDLPSNSMEVLAKVKGIILQLGTGDVAVQGHTDSLGQAKNNQVLSEKRALSVMKYFASGDEMQFNKLSSSGFGYTKPLATNKTEEGRSQNRRVDILITTNQVQ